MRLPLEADAVLVAAGHGIAGAVEIAEEEVSQHYGQWQAQGGDMADPSKGECIEWGQDEVPTKRDGLTWLGGVMDRCTHSQRRLRQVRAELEARRFVQRAPAAGYPTTSRHFYARDDRYPDARIDLEIYGLAFKDDAHG